MVASVFASQQPAFRGGNSYDPDATAAFARMANQPSATQKKRVSDFIVAWKASGKWATDDALWLHAQHDQQASLLNLKGNPAYDCNPFNNPAFRAFGGFMPDGTSSYLSTGFNPADPTPTNHVQNNASLWVRSNTNNALPGSLAGFYDSGAASGTTINPRNNLNNSQTRVHCNTMATRSATTAVGMWIANRIDSAGTRMYLDGVAVANVTVASNPMVSAVYRLGSINDASYRACEFSAGGIGAGFSSDAQALACAMALNNYLDSLRTGEGVTIA